MKYTFPACLLFLAMSCRLAYGDPPSEPAPLAAYCSTGDHQFVSAMYGFENMPLESAATVDAMFEYLAGTYKLGRLYWRGAQAQDWFEHHHFRNGSPLVATYWDYLRRLSLTDRLDEHAIAAARRNGIEIFAWTGVFEHGASADLGWSQRFPHLNEDRLRIAHPEWAPQDRWGERICAGPLDFCFPEVRALLVRRYVNLVEDHGYDGLAFNTYYENWGFRYPGEFGFNEPAVAEFKKRYGVDVRTEPFNNEAWAKLRGEYFTEFLRALHKELSARGKKLAITMKADDLSSPSPWSWGRAKGIDLNSGNPIHMDWETWVEEEIIDDLIVWMGTTREDKMKAARKLMEACKGKPIAVSIGDSDPFSPVWKEFSAAGVQLVGMPKGKAGFYDTSLNPTSLDTLSSEDWKLRAQTLLDIAKPFNDPKNPATKAESQLDNTLNEITIAAPDRRAAIKADSKAVAALAGDRHVLVRRQAIRTLVAMEAKDQLPVLEAALGDAESAVRNSAAEGLGKIGGPDSLRLVLEALSRHPTDFQLQQAVERGLRATKDMRLLLDGMKSPVWQVRWICARVLGHAHRAGGGDALIEALRTDGHAYVRSDAAIGLQRYYSPQTVAALMETVKGTTRIEQLAACVALGNLAGRMTPQQKSDALIALAGLFSQFGDDCLRSDRGFGWRNVGMAILQLDGKGELEKMLRQRTDKWLAWNAYLILYVPQKAYEPVMTTEELDIRNHNQFAPPFPGYRQ